MCQRTTFSTQCSLLVTTPKIMNVHLHKSHMAVRCGKTTLAGSEVESNIISIMPLLLIAINIRYI